MTCLGPEGPRGLTVNSICSVSLHPPLVLVCFDNAARTLPVIRDTRRFGINMLCAEQLELSTLFASKTPEALKFEGVLWAERSGVPVLDGALAWLTCELTELVPAGDHTVGIAEVVELEHDQGAPLVFYRGSYRALAEG